MIHKKMQYRNRSEATLWYIYRGDGHEHQVSNVFHIHSQMLSRDPISRDAEGNVLGIDVTRMRDELDDLASKNQRSEARFAHYVISLPPGESMTHTQWKDTAKTYLKNIGYDEVTKWTAALHAEKDAEHIHILACRVSNSASQKYALVKDSNNYSAGMEAMRGIERKYGLSVTPSPEDTWGRDMEKEEFEGVLNAAKAGKETKAPWKSVVIARLSKAVEQSKGKTFTDFLKACQTVGIEPLVKLNERGFPTGISYAMDGRSEAGAKIKGTRLTFSALTGVKYDKTSDRMKKTGKRNEGISYEQARDISACHAAAIRARNTASTSGFDRARRAVEEAEKEQQTGKKIITDTKKNQRKMTEKWAEIRLKPVRISLRKHGRTSRRVISVKPRLKYQHWMSSEEKIEKFKVIAFQKFLDALIRLLAGPAKEYKAAPKVQPAQRSNKIINIEVPFDSEGNPNMEDLLLQIDLQISRMGDEVSYTPGQKMTL